MFATVFNGLLEVLLAQNLAFYYMLILPFLSVFVNAFWQIFENLYRKTISTGAFGAAAKWFLIHE